MTVCLGSQTLVCADGFCENTSISPSKSRKFMYPYSMNETLPPAQPFCKPGRDFLDAFYVGHNATTDAEKINAVREFFVKEPMLVTGVTDDTELLALEYWVLMEMGFPE